MLALAIVMGLAARMPAEPALQLAPEKGVLVLRNGNLLEGKITKSGDTYYVWRPDGQINIPAADVDLFCRDVEEGYRIKRARLVDPRLHDHLKLCEWCLRHKLLPQGAEQLSKAVALDPNHPAVGLLERRLQWLLQAPPASEAPAGQENGVAAGTPKEAPAPTPATMTGEQLDRLSQELPTVVVAQFTQMIQPTLLNQCTTSGCHLANSGAKWELTRIAGEGPRRRTTQRNLFSTLAWIDREHPDQSPLLTMALQAHGKAKTPPFHAKEMAGYQQLALWVQMAADGKTKPAPKTVQSVAPSGASETPPPTAGAPESGMAAPASADAPVRGLGQPPTGPDRTSKDASSKDKRPPQPFEFAPKDPFDPESFNRQFGEGGTKTP